MIKYPFLFCHIKTWLYLSVNDGLHFISNNYIQQNNDVTELVESTTVKAVTTIGKLIMALM